MKRASGHRFDQIGPSLNNSFAKHLFSLIPKPHPSKVRVDAAVNLPASAGGLLVKAVQSLVPPGGWYATPRDTNHAHVTQTHDWGSRTRFPRFTDGYSVHGGTEFSRNLCVIIDIRGVVQVCGSPEYARDHNTHQH